MPWFWRKAEEDEDEYSSEYDSEDYSSEELDEEDLAANEEPPNDNEQPNAAPEDTVKKIEKEEIQEKETETENPPSRENKATVEKDENGFENQPECVPIEFVKTAKSSARARLDSGLTFGDEEDRDKNDYQLPDSDSDDDSEPPQRNNNTKQKTESEREHPNENHSDDEEEEEEDVTSTAEKLSLLSLAAEHDRVDILNSILAEEKDGPTTLLDGNDNSTIPPLHIAVSYGSVNATNCLLRMGADPSIRPNVNSIQEKTRPNEKSRSHLNRYDDASAWELVFGRDTIALNETTLENRRRTKIEPLDIPLSKREGIRHAFTAEALRCIGSDEVDRLRQLLASGMPHQIDIGGKHLYDWSVEMGALKCEELLRPTQLRANSNGEETNGNGPKKSVVLNRGEPQSISSLLNRLDESQALSNALSSCLDNLGEEVAVCSGLLLLGSGASALASHVRSLRSSLESKQDELDRLQEAWVNSEDELEYWVKKCGPEGEKIASQIFLTKRGPPESNEDEEHQRQQLIGQIAASESKIRMLRVSIADLSEENARNLSEVEKRGLSGGINLVRGLREQIKDLDYKISLVKSGDAECCTKISLLQSKFHSMSQNPDKGSVTSTKKSGELPSVTAEIQPTGKTVESQLNDTGKPEKDSSVTVTSDQISTGQSTAIVLRPPGDRGFFPLSLWTILMRIIGLGDPQIRRQNSRSTPAVII